MTREHRQAYMEGFGAAMLADDYREQTAELSQEFAEFGAEVHTHLWTGGPKKGWSIQKNEEIPLLYVTPAKRGMRDRHGKKVLHFPGEAFPVKDAPQAVRDAMLKLQLQTGTRVFGTGTFGSDFKPIDPACYAPGGAPGCEFGAATLKSKGWKRGPHGESYTKTINGYPNTIQMLWPVIEGEQWQGDNSGELTEGFPTPSAAAAELERWGLRERAKGRNSGYFGRMGVPAGMQLPGSWGVPHASMVRPGETPEGWDPNLFRGFGGRFDKAALRKQREDFKTIYRDADIDLRKATDRYHANPTLSALTQVRKFGNRRNKAWKKMMKIQQQLGNKGLPFVAPVEDPWWNQ